MSELRSNDKYGKESIPASGKSMDKRPWMGGRVVSSRLAEEAGWKVRQGETPGAPAATQVVARL